MTIPSQPEVEAAWHALPSHIRDRIGIIAVDMVFQGFVSGASYGPDDQAVPGDGSDSIEVRGLASEACDRRLAELHDAIENVLPNLFGPDGENPEWAVAMGAKR